MKTKTKTPPFLRPSNISQYTQNVFCVSAHLWTLELLLPLGFCDRVYLAPCTRSWVRPRVQLLRVRSRELHRWGLGRVCVPVSEELPFRCPSRPPRSGARGSTGACRRLKTCVFSSDFVRPAGAGGWGSPSFCPGFPTYRGKAATSLLTGRCCRGRPGGETWSSVHGLRLPASHRSGSGRPVATRVAGFSCLSRVWDVATEAFL